MRTSRQKIALISDPRLEGFLQSLRAEDLSPVTVKGYGNDLKFFQGWVKDALPTLRLEDLDAQVLGDFRDYLTQERRARPATVNRKLEALRRLCRWAHDSGIHKSNVAEKMRPMRQVRGRRPQHPRGNEVLALLRAAGSGRRNRLRNYALVVFLLETGVRVSEVVSLVAGDVILRERTGILRVRRGKGRKERDIPLTAKARRALREYLAGRGKVRDNAPLFLSDRGGAMSVRSVEDTISNLAQRGGIDRINVTPHTCRHSFAHRFLRRSPDRLTDLAYLLGHESSDTTAIYTKPSFDELADDLERISVSPW